MVKSMLKIKDFVVGEVITTNLVVSEASIRQTKTKPPRDYVTLTLSDGNHTIDGKIWDWNGGSAPESKKIYGVLATVGEYLGKKQLTIAKLIQTEDQDMTEFMTSVGVPIDELRGLLYEAIDSIQHLDLQVIVCCLYERYMEDILRSTAAKGVHHVGVGGLALHLIEVFKTVEGIYQAYPHIGLNLDLLKAGALVHDIGKIHTYEQDGPVIEYTAAGHILDHISIGMLMLQDVAAKLPAHLASTIELLQHIVASHHGQLEYGSPVTPKFMEAYIINFADNISATLDTINTANKDVVNDAKLTAKIFACGNRPQLTQTTVAQILSGNTVL